MNRLSYWKVPFAMSAVLVASLISGCKGCNGEKWPKQVNVTKYATPYAVAPATRGDKPCPPKGSWNPVPSAHGQNYQKDQNDAAASRPKRPGVDEFCVYKWTPRGAQKLPEEKDFKDIDGTPEHALLAISGPTDEGEPSPTKVYDLLQKQFEKKAFGFTAAGLERLKSLEAGRAAAAGSLPPVKLAIVDATPLGMMQPDRSGHGYAVSRIAGTLACADPNSEECTKRVVVPYLALPIIGEVEGDFTEDWKTGGRAGTLVQLYDALDAAIEEWRPHRDKQHLVINLSLGWDPVKLDPKDPSVVRIRTALERAWCLGALIVAAAGNYTGSVGPIYPAAFESLPIPDPDRCKILAPAAVPNLAVVPGISRTGEAPYAPLVHSVGAVDVNDKRILINRRWGQPRVSAMGVGVSVAGPPGQPPTPSRSGTSVAAAAVSGMATRIWTAEPNLDAAGVMKAIYEGGVELKVGHEMERPQTEYCLDQPYGPCARWPVHRAYLCGAMAQAMSDPKPTCDQTPPPSLPKWTHHTPPTEPAPEKCTLTECGIPNGPNENQLAAAVGGHGYGSCDFCSFHVDETGTITLQGTPRTAFTTMIGFTAVLNTDANPAVRIYPQFNVPFNDMPVQPMSPATTTAYITWTIQVSNIFSYTYQTPLPKI